MNRLLFSDEVMFHLLGQVIWHNVRIWRCENPCESFEHERDNLKVNVLTAIS